MSSWLELIAIIITFVLIMTWFYLGWLAFFVGVVLALILWALIAVIKEAFSSLREWQLSPATSIVDPDPTDKTKLKAADTALKEKLKRLGPEARLHAKVKKLKERVYKLGLETTVLFLHQEIRHYPSWIGKFPERVCPLVTDVKELEEKNEKLGFVLNGRDYTIEFKAPVFDRTYDEYDSEYGKLTLQSDNKRVLEVWYSRDWDTETKWRAFEVSAFIEGEWVKAIQDLKKALSDVERIFRKQVLSPYKQQEMKNLKEGFGLEDSDLE